jgi:signal transduction histidine kinase
MFTAMNRIRSHLIRLAQERSVAPSHPGITAAIDQILDLELAIMLDTYREDLVEKMRVRERLATLGQLSAMIAHELRNPLGTIESSLYLIRKRAEKLALSDAVVSKHLDKISSQVHECGTTIHNLLNLVRERPLQRRPIKAVDLLNAALASLAIPDRVHVTISAADDLVIAVDADQMRTTLANLLRNAVQATQGETRVTLAAERGEQGVRIVVGDDGPGVPKELHSKIFDVLFTTKASGTGLGLALARRICAAHGGSLELLPSERGAVFEILVPDETASTSPIETAAQ